MDITKFVVSHRENALLYGDYSTYRAQLSRKLLNSRKKLNIATKSRGKFHPKAQITAEQISENHEYESHPVLSMGGSTPVGYPAKIMSLIDISTSRFSPPSAHGLMPCP